MEDGVGNGGGDAGDADLADSAATHGVEVVIGLIDPGDVYLGDIGVDGDEIAGQVGVDRAAVLRVVGEFFEQGMTYAEDDSSDELAAGGFRAQNAATVEHTDDAGDTDAADLFDDSHFDEVGAKGLKRVLVILAKNRRGLPQSFDRRAATEF